VSGLVRKSSISTLRATAPRDSPSA